MGKRANGEGSITRRKDGRYAASLTVGWRYDPRTGKTRQDRRWHYSYKRKDCKDWLDQMIARRDSGRLGTRPLRTVGEFLSAWLEEVVRPNRRAKTYLTYASYCKVHFMPVLESVALDKLSARQITGWRNDCAARGVSESTTAQMMTVLGVALNVAVDWGLLAYNPVSRVEKPPVRRQERPVLTTEQATLLLAAIARDRLFALWVLQLMFGFRIGEVCGLRWEDVDLDGGILRVRWQIQRATGEGLKLVVVKTDDGRRDMTLPRLAVQVLTRHRAAQHEEARVLAGVWRDTGHVFTTVDGGPIDPGALRLIFYRILSSAGLPRVHFHDLRHTAGTRLAEDGVDVKVISGLLGHANTTITRELYLHTTPRMKRDVADRLDILFGDMGLG